MPDIEVTDEMIEAGETEAAKHIVRIDDANVYLPAPALAAIYRAMRAKEREQTRAKALSELARADADLVGVSTPAYEGSGKGPYRIDPDTFLKNLAQMLRPPHDIPIPDA